MSAPIQEPQSPTAELTLPALVVETEWLHHHLEHPSLRLLDLRAAESFAAGHIPGAIPLHLPDLAHVEEGVQGMLLPAQPFAAHLGRLGVSHQHPVVIYDDNWGMPAARVLWALARYGHRRAAILNGGWDRWHQEQRPISLERVAPPPALFAVEPDESQIARRSWLLQRLQDPGTVIVDTRTPGEYAQGHIPGALQWDWMNGVPSHSWDAMRSDAALPSELIAHGITPDKEIVTYCRSGVRAAHTYALLRQLGYPRVRNYDGSWLEWSHYLDKTRSPT